MAGVDWVGLSAEFEIGVAGNDGTVCERLFEVGVAVLCTFEVEEEETAALGPVV